MVIRSGILRRTLPLAVIGKKSTVNQDIKTINTPFGEISEFLYWYFAALETEILEKYQKDGTTVESIDFEKFQDIEIVLPPLSEQKRIIAQLKTLLHLIDVMSSESVQIKTTIEKAKSKILDLAMQGKLVPQDLTDEPAAEMLRRINPKAKIITDNPHYRAIPRSWATVRFTDVCETALGKTLNKGTDLGELRPYLCAVNVKNGYFNLSTIKQAKILPEEFERYSVYKGDLLVCEGGDVGRCAIWQGDRIFYQNALHRIRPLMGIEQKFLKYFLLYAKKRHWIDELCSGVTIKHFTTKAMSNLVIAIPPDNEQIRIIEKLESIFELLNVIEKTLKS